MPATAEVIALAVAGDEARLRALVRDEPALASVRNQFGATPVLAAHYSGHVALRDWLIEVSGTELDVSLAAQLGMSDRVEALVRADPGLANARTAGGSSVLHAACYWAARDTAEVLLRHGADVMWSETRPLGIAPLGSAVASADIPNPSRDEHAVLGTVLLLLEYGADVNHRRNDGLTALHTAAYRGQLDVVRALLAAGADTSHTGREGTPHASETAEVSARNGGHPEAAALIRNYELHHAGDR